MAKPRSKFKKVKWLFGKEIEIPEEWEIHTVESVSKKIVSGGTPSTTMLEYWNGNIPWTRSSVLLDPYLKSGEKFITAEGLRNSSSVLIPKNNLLVSSRVSVGNISISAIDVAISQDVTGIIINKAYARSEFLYWYLKQHIKKLVLISQGTTIQGFTRKELAKLLVFLPSLSEQQKIASVLSGVDALIESTQKVIEKTERLKKGLMQKLLTRGIGHTEFKKVKWLFGKEIEIPENWSYEKLSQFCEKEGDVVAGPFGSNLIVNDYRKQGIPIIRLQNIERNQFIEKNLQFIDKKKAKELQYHSYKPSDLVLAKLGDPIGKTCRIPANFSPGIVVADVVRIRPSKQKTDYRFMEYALNSDLCKKQLNKEKIGTTRPRVNLKQVRNLQLPLSPFPEQTKIASILSGVDAYVKKNQDCKKKMERLKKGLMQKLLSGQIRVKDH